MTIDTGNPFPVKQWPNLMRAAREQGNQNHQVPRREQPLFCFIADSLGGSCDEAQAMPFRKTMQVVRTNSGKVSDLCVGENFLARFNDYHGPSVTISGVTQILRIQVRFRRTPFPTSRSASVIPRRVEGRLGLSC